MCQCFLMPIGVHQWQVAMAAWVHSSAGDAFKLLFKIRSATAGVYGLAALLHDHFFAYSIDMSTAAEEVRPHCRRLCRASSMSIARNDSLEACAGSAVQRTPHPL